MYLKKTGLRAIQWSLPFYIRRMSLDVFRLSLGHDKTGKGYAVQFRYDEALHHFARNDGNWEYWELVGIEKVTLVIFPYQFRTERFSTGK